MRKKKGRASAKKRIRIRRKWKNAIREDIFINEKCFQVNDGTEEGIEKKI